MEKVKFYIAGRYARRTQLLQYAGVLIERGLECTARWVSGKHDIPHVRQITTEHVKDVGHTYAAEDEEDIRAADLFLTFTDHTPIPSDLSLVEMESWARGGRHTELGLAIALRKRIVIVGPLESIFYMHAYLHLGAFVYETFPSALANLMQWAKPEEPTKEKPERGDPRYYHLLDLMWKMHQKKGYDYSGPNDSLKNLRRCINIGLKPFQGVMVRLGDKHSRAEELTSRRYTTGEGPSVTSESLFKTLFDDAAYRLLGILLLAEEEGIDIDSIDFE